MKLKFDWALLVITVILLISLLSGWFWASSVLSGTGNFVGDVFVGFMFVFFGLGIVIQIANKFSASHPKGIITTKQWIDKVDSLKVK